MFAGFAFRRLFCLRYYTGFVPVISYVVFTIRGALNANLFKPKHVVPFLQRDDTIYRVIKMIVGLFI